MYMPGIFGDIFMDPWFERESAPERRQERRPAKNLMRTDIKEYEGGYELLMDLPGYKKEDVQVKLEKGTLTVTAGRNAGQEENSEDGHFIRRERYCGSCERSFYVGEDLTQKDITGSFKEGVLTLYIPKKEALPEKEEDKFITIE